MIQSVLGLSQHGSMQKDIQKSIGRDNPENDRFLVIIQALTIWINAKNLGVACDDEIPDSIKSYIAILKEYFGIEVEHLLK